MKRRQENFPLRSNILLFAETVTGSVEGGREIFAYNLQCRPTFHKSAERYKWKNFLYHTINYICSKLSLSQLRAAE